MSPLRSDPSIVRSSGAPELGLAVVIRKRSEGSPRASAAGQATAARPAFTGGTEKGSKPERRERTVLSVEDSPTHLKILCRYLGHSEGCRALPANGVEEAVVTLLRERPDLIVTDLMMPDLDGLDLLAILQARKDWRDIPVVIISALSESDRVQALTGLGVKDYIVKPFNPSLALPRLRKVLESCPPTGASRPTDLLLRQPGKIPVLLVTNSTEIDGSIRKAVDALYDVLVVGSGPAAVAAAVEIRPWRVFLTRDLGSWDSAKTMRSLLALKTLHGIRVIRLPHHEGGAGALTDAVRRELSAAPFAVARAGGLITATLEETFAPSCLDALRQALDEAMRTETEQVVFELPPGGVGQQVLTSLQKVVQEIKGRSA